MSRIPKRLRRGRQKRPKYPFESTRLVVGCDYRIDGHAKGQEPHYGQLTAIRWRDGYIWLSFKILPDDRLHDVGGSMLHIPQPNISNIRQWDRTEKVVIPTNSNLILDETPE